MIAFERSIWYGLVERSNQNMNKYNFAYAKIIKIISSSQPNVFGKAEVLYLSEDGFWKDVRR